MQELERQQQEQFARELEQQAQQLRARQQEHLAELSRQRGLAQEQAAHLQERQTQALRRQQEQSQALLAQMHARMEQELRARGELARNQLGILMELQGSQQDGQALDLTELMKNLKHGEEGSKKSNKELTDREW